MKKNLLSLRIGLMVGILASAALMCARHRNGAWERWGITRPAPDAAEPGLAAACSLLYATKYDSALPARPIPTLSETVLAAPRRTWV